MSNELQVFNYQDREVRTVEIDGEAWLVAKDVCDILGLSNVTMALNGLDDDEKMTLSNSEGHSRQRGGAQMFNVINEPGLYKLTFKSRKPEAKEFTRWVTHEVLPSIRKSGIYMNDKAADAYLNNPELFKQMAERCSSLERRIAEMEKSFEETKPLTILGSVVLAQKGSVTFKDAADMLAQHGIDIGQNRLFKRCRDKKLLCSRKGKQWNKPTHHAIEKGLLNIQISGGFYAITMITPKGLQSLADELIAENYPLLVLLNSTSKE